MKQEIISKAEEINHTADLAVKVSSDSWPGLVSVSVRATSQLLAEADPNSEPIKWQFHCQGVDRLSVLISLLNEMLYHFEMGLLPTDITVTSLSDIEIQGEFIIHPILSNLHRIKAVTYNGGNIQVEENMFSVLLVYDI